MKALFGAGRAARFLGLGGETRCTPEPLERQIDRATRRLLDPQRPLPSARLNLFDLDRIDQAEIGFASLPPAKRVSGKGRRFIYNLQRLSDFSLSETFL